MKKLDDLPKTNIFEVPDGYFEGLPMRIQARLEKPAQASRPVWHLAFRYALPSVIVVFALFYFLRPKSFEAEELLASISSEHLIAYLHDSDINEGDLIDAAHFDEEDADSLSRQLTNNLFGEADPGSYAEEFERALEHEL